MRVPVDDGRQRHVIETARRGLDRTCRQTQLFAGADDGAQAGTIEPGVHQLAHAREAHWPPERARHHRQTRGAVTHFVAGIGTGGTVMGTGRYLKEVNPKIQVIAVEPDDALHGLEGLKHMASSIVPGIYHEQKLDGKIAVSTEDAYSVVYRLSQEEGILVGQSSGAAMFAAIKLARTLRKGTIVTIFPDFGDKYLTTNLWVGWRDRMSVGNLQFSI